MTPIYSLHQGNADLMPLVEEYVNRLKERLIEMREELQFNRWENVKRTIHQLKGTAGVYGYPCLTQIATRLETAVDARDSKTTASILDEIGEMVQCMDLGLRFGRV